MNIKVTYGSNKRLELDNAHAEWILFHDVSKLTGKDRQLALDYNISKLSSGLSGKCFGTFQDAFWYYCDHYTTLEEDFFDPKEGFENSHISSGEIYTTGANIFYRDNKDKLIGFVRIRNES